MYAIRELRRLGFEFSITREGEQSRESGEQPTGDSGERCSAPKIRINYRFIGEQRPPKEVTYPLFRQLRLRKKDAVEYLSGPHFRKKEYCDEATQWEEARLQLEKYGFFLLESGILDDTIAVLKDGVEREQIPMLNTGCFKDVPCYEAEEVRMLWRKGIEQGLEGDSLRRIHEAKREFDGRVMR